MQQRQEAYDLLRSAAADPQRGVLLTHKKILADTRLRGSGKLLVMLLDSLAIKFGRRVLDISTPKLGELIGESSQAVANLLRRLEGLGYLTVIDKPSRGQTAGWQVEVFDPELPGLVGKRDPQPELFEEAAEQEEIEQQEDPQVIKLAQRRRGGRQAAGGRMPAAGR